jgi:hypothetical protein
MARKTKKNKRTRSLKKGGDGDRVTYCCTKKDGLANNGENTCAFSTTGYCFSNKHIKGDNKLQKISCEGPAPADRQPYAEDFTIKYLTDTRTGCRPEELTPKLWRPWETKEEGGKRRSKKNKSKRSKK